MELLWFAEQLIQRCKWLCTNVPGEDALDCAITQQIASTLARCDNPSKILLETLGTTPL